MLKYKCPSECILHPQFVGSGPAGGPLKLALHGHFGCNSQQVP